MPPAFNPGAAPDLWPFAVLGLSVLLIVVLITRLRVHAFLALILAAFTAGLLARPGSLGGKPGVSHLVQAIELTAQELGATAGKIGIVIALAAVIGVCLAESGAADKVVRRFLEIFGQKRAGVALLAASFVLSIPIFFDTFFMLVLPLARALALRTGKNYVLYVLAICSGGVITHSLVAPHPGPLAMAEILQIDVGQSLIAGLLIGAVPMIASWFLIKRLDARTPVPVRPRPGDARTDAEIAMERPESELPSFVLSILPVVLPIALISLASTLVAVSGFSARHPLVFRAAEFAGNRNVALLIGAAFAMAVVMRQRRWSFSKVSDSLGPAFETAGVIILITSAGGAFGLMLKNAGVGTTIQAVFAGRQIDLILLGWGVAAVLRLAQGSATVALLTTSAMLQPMLAGGAPLPYHPIYVFAAIGFGGMIFSWMNDSGFWVVGRLSGLTERETLRTWSVLLTFNSVVGLLTTLLLSRLLPLV